jgi:hypothetical protein
MHGNFQTGESVLSTGFIVFTKWIRINLGASDAPHLFSTIDKEKTMLSRFRLLIAVLVSLLILSACNFPTRDGEGPDAGQLTLTSVAETVRAEITQSGTSVPPTLPATVTFNPPNTQVPPASTTMPCNYVYFIMDVTVEDGTQFLPGENFTKVWRLKNGGSCTWNTAYGITFESGDAMGAPVTVYLPGQVLPGQEVDVAVAMKAPMNPGTYRGNWKMRDQGGTKFGGTFYADIQVRSLVTNTPGAGTTVKYNFVNQMCSATWTSEAGTLPCPGANNDDRGFVLSIADPKLETGAQAGAPALETHPLWSSNPAWTGNGSIKGVFPAVNIQSGDRFVAQVGCLHGGASCDVQFYLRYDAGSGVQTLGQWPEVYDNSMRTVDIDLSALNGKAVEFILVVEANATPGQDWALWVAPRIVR